MRKGPEGLPSGPFALVCYLRGGDVVHLTFDPPWLRTLCILSHIQYIVDGLHCMSGGGQPSYADSVVHIQLMPPQSAMTLPISYGQVLPLWEPVMRTGDA